MKKADFSNVLKHINRVNIICLVISLSALLAGLAPYLFIRTSSTYLSSFINQFFDFERIPLNKEGLLYSLITSFLSDFCWAFSMPFAIFALTAQKYSKAFYVFITPIVGGILELFQLFGIIDGTGDIIDILIYFVASALGYTIIEKVLKKPQKKA